MVRRLTQPMKSIRTLMRYLKIVTEDFLAMVMHTGCKFKSNSLMNVRAYDETGTEAEQKEKNKRYFISALEWGWNLQERDRIPYSPWH